jgi:hypothetical protein
MDSRAEAIRKSYTYDKTSAPRRRRAENEKEVASVTSCFSSRLENRTKKTTGKVVADDHFPLGRFGAQFSFPFFARKYAFQRRRKMPIPRAPPHPKTPNYPRRMNRPYERQEAGKPVHEDVAVAGERLAAEEAGVEKVPLRRRQPARSSSSRSGHADELVLHAGADQPGPRRCRCPAPSKCVRVVQAAGAASAADPARAAEGGVHRRRRSGSPGGIHLSGFSRLIRPPARWLACSCLCDGALRGEREGRRCLKRRQEVEVVFFMKREGALRGGGAGPGPAWRCWVRGTTSTRALLSEF